MRRKIKTIIAVFISILPFSSVRIALYRSALGYRIEDSFVGWGTVIVVDHFSVINSRIGMLNVFLGPMSVDIKSEVSVGHKNKFDCGWWTTDPDYKHLNFCRRILLNRGCMITNNHHFDLAGSFVLGERSWVAGCGSQFWTHGAGVVDRDISIGSQCYIGSAVRFAPGASVGNNVIVSLGSVVVHGFSDGNVMIAGVPARIVKQDYDWNKV